MIFVENVSFMTFIKTITILIATFAFRDFISTSIMKLVKKLTDQYNLKYLLVISIALKKPLYNLITFSGVYLALVFMPFNSSITLFVYRLYRTFIIIVITKFLIEFTSIYFDIINDSFFNKDIKSDKLQISKTVFPLLAKLIKAIIIIVAIVLVAIEFDFKQLNSILAGLGIGGAAIALASQDLIKNFFGGFVILTDKSFNVGDYIKVDSFDGTVEELGLRSTKIRTPDKELVIIPNSRFTDREVINYTMRENRRANFIISLYIDTSYEKVQATIETIKFILDNHHSVKKDSPLVVLDSFGKNSLDIIVQYLTNTADYTEFMKIKGEINLELVQLLNEAGIIYALPSMSINLANN